MPKLTKRIVESAVAEERDIMLWDSELRGFGCKVTPKGKRNYFLFYRTQDGRQRKPKIGAHGAITCEQAREIARQWLAMVDKGEDPSLIKQEKRQSPTIRELFERYMEEYAPGKKPRSREEDNRLWRLHILPVMGTMKVKSITSDDIRRFHRSMHAHIVNANRARSLLSKAFSLCEEWGWRPEGSNPCAKVKPYKEQKRERFLSMEEIRRLSAVLAEREAAGLESPHMIGLIRLLLLTGCRLNEIMTLRWEYVDWEHHCLRLPDSKTGAKVVYLSPPALEALQGLPRLENNPYVIAGHRQGSHMVNPQKPWRRIREAAGLEDVRIHDLRHSFASVGAASGLSLPMIGALLGHSQANTTQRYAHLVGDPLKEATAMIGQRIIGAMSGAQEHNTANIVKLPKRPT